MMSCIVSHINIWYLSLRTDWPTYLLCFRCELCVEVRNNDRIDILYTVNHWLASAYSYFINAIARHPHTRLACKLRDKWWGMSIVINNNVYLKYVKYILNYQLIATKYMLNWWYSLVTHGRQGQRLFYKKKNGPGSICLESL